MRCDTRWSGDVTWSCQKCRSGDEAEVTRLRALLAEATRMLAVMIGTHGERCVRYPEPCDAVVHAREVLTHLRGESK